MKKICVFCASEMGSDSRYVNEIKELGHSLAYNNIGLVYGGSKVGLMGTVANAVLEKGGKVWGVIDEIISHSEIEHRGLTELYRVPTIMERKKMLLDLSNALFTFPGGVGTVDELFETLVWSKRKMHKKVCYLINLHGFFDGVVQYLNKAEELGYISYDYLDLVITKDSNEAIKHFISH